MRINTIVYGIDIKTDEFLLLASVWTTASHFKETLEQYNKLKMAKRYTGIRGIVIDFVHKVPRMIAELEYNKITIYQEPVEESAQIIE